jgi:hypothetical protein
VRARGRLERREGTINVLVSELAQIERAEGPGDAPLDRPGERAPRFRRSRRRLREHAIAELRAVAPAGHSFGRRGR